LKGEWPGKLQKEANYRRKRSKEMGRRQKENHPLPTVAPNVDGERVDSWSEAKKLAADKGHDTSNYDEKVRKLSKSP
jgi:hypothetical protein